MFKHPPRGGGHSGTEGYFLKTSACPRFCKKKGTFLYPGTKYGGENPLTIHEIYAALTPSDARSDWGSEFAAAKQAEDYIKSKVKIRVPVHPMSVF